MTKIIIDIDDKKPICSTCKGKKKIDQNAPFGKTMGHIWIKCPDCVGTGYQKKNRH